MVDDNNDGVVTYEELKRFLLDVMYSESSAKHRMVAKVDKLITEKLGFQTYDRLKEQEFAELVVNNKSTFTPMLALYSSLNKLFTHAFEPSSAKHTTQEVKQYFNQDGSGESGEMVDDDYGGGGGGGERRNSAGEYSPAAARSAAKG